MSQDGRTPGSVAPAVADADPASSPYDAAGGARAACCARLRASAGATRVSVWVHEATTEMVVPFRQAVARGSRRPPRPAGMRTAVTL